MKTGSRTAPHGETAGGRTAREAPAVEGGCFCNLVRYRIEREPIRVLNCHCTMCRRASGAPYVTWMTVPAAGFSFTRKRPFRFDSSSRAERTFCDECGTPLTFQYKAHRETMDVTVGSLDAPERFAPTMDIHTRSHVRWVPLDPGLKRHDGTFTDE
jgi:hypothetical protein